MDDGKSLVVLAETVLSTGHSDLLDRETARKMGIDHFFHKPLSAEVLAKAVREALDRNLRSRTRTIDDCWKMIEKNRIISSSSTPPLDPEEC